MLDINDINQVELAALPRCVVVQQPLHRSCALQFWRDFSTLSTWRGGHRASPKMLQIAGQLCKNQKILMWQVQTLSFSFLMFFSKLRPARSNLFRTFDKLWSYIATVPSSAWGARPCQYRAPFIVGCEGWQPQLVRQGFPKMSMGNIQSQLFHLKVLLVLVWGIFFLDDPMFQLKSN